MRPKPHTDRQTDGHSDRTTHAYVGGDNDHIEEHRRVWLTDPLRTPRTRLSTKKEPMMMRLTK